jgi:hypothetical protein
MMSKPATNVIPLEGSSNVVSSLIRGALAGAVRPQSKDGAGWAAEGSPIHRYQRVVAAREIDRLGCPATFALPCSDQSNACTLGDFAQETR